MGTATDLTVGPMGSEPPESAQVSGPTSFLPFLDRRCSAVIQLGTGTITIRDCLTLEPGVVVPLDQVAGEELRILASGVLLAFGEVEVEEDSTVIRVTRIAGSPRGQASR